MTGKRLRIAHVAVQPVLVWDDGVELSPGPQVSPAQVAVSDVAGLAAQMPAELERLEQQHRDNEV